jgi:ribose transport system permease protein
MSVKGTRSGRTEPVTTAPTDDAVAEPRAAPRAGAARVRAVWAIVGRIGQVRELALLLFLVLAGLVVNIFLPGFLGWTNLKVILLGMSFDAIIAVGMTILLVSGGFDLSVGAVMALAGSVTGLALGSGTLVVAIVEGVLVGACVGLVNGLVIARLGVNPLITTLGTMSVVNGAVLLLTGEQGVSNLPGVFAIPVGQATPFGIQTPILVMAVIVIVGDVLLRRTRFLRQNYYIGANIRSARLSGIKVVRIQVFNYVLVAALAALAGILTAARQSGISTNTGGPDALQVIAAVVIGGASLSGGEGTVLGSFLGLFLLNAILNVISGLGINPDWGPVITGTVLVLAVTLDQLGRLVRLQGGWRGAGRYLVRVVRRGS